MKATRLAVLLCVFSFCDFEVCGASSATTIDPTFQPVTLSPTNSYVLRDNFATVQPDGRILIAGAFTSVNGEETTTRLVRLNGDGSIDTTFSADLPAGGPSPSSVALQPDGKILLNVQSSSGFVTRLNPDGSADASFKMFTFSRPDVARVSPSGQIYVAGPNVRSSDFADRNIYVARLTTTGGLDRMFRTHSYIGLGMAEDGIVQLGFQSDSRVIVGGYFSTDAGHRSLARFNLDGTEDLSFDTTAVAQDTYPFSITVQPDDKILYASSGPRFVRFKSNGNLDAVFPLPEKADRVLSVACQADGKILAAVSIDLERDLQLIRYNPDTTVDTSFSLDPAQKARGVLVQPDGRILLLGSFTIPDPKGLVTTHLIRLRGDPVVFSGVTNSELNVQLSWKILDSTMSYRLEGSDDFVDWELLRVIAPGQTTVSLSELRHTLRFYRILLQ